METRDTRKWFPLQGELAPVMYFLINNKPTLIHSMLAAGIIQDTFAGEAVEDEGGEEETIVPKVENIFLGLQPREIFLPWVQYIPIFHSEGLNI